MNTHQHPPVPHHLASIMAAVAHADSGFGIALVLCTALKVYAACYGSHQAMQQS